MTLSAEVCPGVFRQVTPSSHEGAWGVESIAVILGFSFVVLYHITFFRTHGTGKRRLSAHNALRENDLWVWSEVESAVDELDDDR
eukprot:747762-Hanusia_phi.AAC.3